MASGIQEFESQLKSAMPSSFNEIQSSISNQQMNTTITETMRSFKDQMSFNLQSLNLTLSTLSNSMSNLGAKIGGLTPNSAGRYIESGLQPGSFLGSISRNYANAQGQFINAMSTIGGNSAFVERPYNISPMEFYTGAQMQRDFYRPKLAANVLSGVIGALTPGATLSTMALSGFWQGTHGYMDTADMIRRMSGRFSPGGTMNQNGALAVAKGIQRLGYNELLQSTSMDNRLGVSGYKDIAALGLQTDMFKGKTPDELLKQIQNAGKVVKLLTGVLGSQDVQEAMQSLTQMKNMGVNVANNPALAKALVQNSYGYGTLSGITGGQMLNAGMQISQAGLGTNGIPAGIGVQQGMKNLAYINEMRKRGLISGADLAAAGGAQSMAARMLGISGDILNSGVGQTLLAAGLQNSGAFSSGQALHALQNGGITGTVGSAVNNLFSGEGLFANSAYMSVHRNKLLAQMTKDDPDALQKLVDTQLRLEMSHNNIYNRSSLTAKRDLMAQHLMINYGKDSGTSITTANRVLDPTVARETDYLNRAAQARSDVDRSKVYGSIGGMFSRAVVDPIEKIGEKYITQPMVKLGETITNWFKRSAQTRDIGSSLVRGNELLYSDEIDKNGNKTGLQKRISLDELETRIGGGIDEAERIRKKNYDYGSSQYIRAANMVTNGGGGTLGRSAIATLWNSLGAPFGGQDLNNDEKTQGIVFGEFKDAYKKDFDIITEGTKSQLNGAEDVTGLINAMIDKSGRGKQGNYSGPKRNISNIELRESGETYENNPFAYGLDIIRKSGLKNNVALLDLQQNKASQGTADFAKSYLDPLMASVNNMSPFDSKSMLNTLSGFIAAGEKQGYKRTDLMRAFYQYKNKDQANFSIADRLKATNLEQAVAIGSTEEGEKLRMALGTNREGTASWKTGEFMNLTGTGNLSEDVISSTAQNNYEIARNTLGTTNNTLALLKNLHGQMTRGKDRLTYEDFLAQDPDRMRKWVKSILPKDQRNWKNVDAEIKRLKDLTEYYDGDVDRAVREMTAGETNDLYTTIAAQGYGGKVSGTQMARDGLKYGIKGGLLASAYENFDILKELNQGTNQEAVDAFETTVDQLSTLRGGKILTKEQIGNAGKFVADINKKRQKAKGDEKQLKAIEEESKKFFASQGYDVTKISTNQLEETVSKLTKIGDSLIRPENRFTQDKADAANTSVLEKSVKSAIDSIVATYQGTQVAMVMDVNQNMKDIKDNRKALKEDIKQVDLKNTIFGKYTNTATSGKATYEGD